tara:strand:- start:4436 stop:5152 length:717 start_codon:yes stop_codon:yes gene_type:complete
MVAGLVVAQSSAMAAPAKDADLLKTQQDKISYTIGVDMGENLKAQSLDINADLLARGIKDGMSGENMLMTKDEMQNTLVKFQKEFIAQQAKKIQEEGAKNQKAGEKFLADNKKKPGVKTLPSGLQYKVLTPGNGQVPTDDDSVTVEYEGKTLDGTVFDSTYTRGKPATFKVSQMIPGWQEALQSMKSGSTWMVYIPPKLAYGARGLGGPIGPNETLIFKVHLISVAKGSADASSAKTN